MAAFTTAAVSNRSTSRCTITFNAAVLDLNAAQVKQLALLFARLVLEVTGQQGGNASGTITFGAFV